MKQMKASKSKKKNENNEHLLLNEKNLEDLYEKIVKKISIGCSRTGTSSPFKKVIYILSLETIYNV